MESLTVIFAFAKILPAESLATAWYLITCLPARKAGGTCAKSIEENKERQAERRKFLIVSKILDQNKAALISTMEKIARTIPAMP